MRREMILENINSKSSCLVNHDIQVFRQSIWSQRLTEERYPWYWTNLLIFVLANSHKNNSHSTNGEALFIAVLWNSLPQSIKYSEQWIYYWIKNENGRPRKYWLLMYFVSMNIIKNKSFIHPVDAWTYFDINVVYSCLCMAATLILL